MLSKSNTYCGFVAIVGRPNVGKSTLLNTILGQKISITSKKPQTTRHRILGIDTQDNIQTIFIDTPGLHIEEKRAINRLMNRAAASTLPEVELIIFVINKMDWTEDDSMILNKLKNQSRPVILVINKIDQVKNKAHFLPFITTLKSQYQFAEVVLLSAKNPQQVQSLQHLITPYIPHSEFYFPEDYITDRSARFMVSEIVREKLMRFTGEELPYSVTVEIEQYQWDQQSQVWRISALILVERETQKRMVIGNKGEKLKIIGRDARLDIERLIEQKVFLSLWVKVKRGWADDERALNSLGYGS